MPDAVPRSIDDPDPGKRAETATPNAEDVDDRLLMARLAIGDEVSYAELLRRYWPRLAAFAARMTGSPDTGQDIAQEAFVRVWQHREDWRPTGSVAAYLFRITRHLCTDHDRQKEVRFRAAASVRSLYAGSATPAAVAESNELHTRLHAAIDRLPARRRETLLLVHFEGLSYREAAEVTGTAVSTVANQLSAALAELRRELRELLQPQA